MLQIVFSQLPLQPRIRHLPRHRRLRHFLHIPNTRRRRLPIRHILALDLNHRHPRIVRRAIMHPVAQVPKPRTHRRRIEFLDLRVVVRNRGCRAGHRHPVLAAAVLERDLHFFGALEVGEFLRVRVREEVEVRAFALGDGHAAGDGAGALAVGGEEADFQPVDDFVEVFDLVVFGGFGVPLFGDGGVGLGGDVGGLKRFRHCDGSGSFGRGCWGCWRFLRFWV